MVNQFHNFFKTLIKGSGVYLFVSLTVRLVIDLKVWTCSPTNFINSNDWYTNSNMPVSLYLFICFPEFQNRTISTSKHICFFPHFSFCVRNSLGKQWQKKNAKNWCLPKWKIDDGFGQWIPYHRGQQITFAHDTNGYSSCSLNVRQSQTLWNFIGLGGSALFTHDEAQASEARHAQKQKIIIRIMKKYSGPTIGRRDEISIWGVCFQDGCCTMKCILWKITM